jgi:hypothetical protein
MAFDERADHVLFGQLTSTRLDHADRLLGAGDEEVQLALRLHVGRGRVDVALPFPEAHADRAHRRVERDVGDAKRRRGADDREGVGLVERIRGPEQRADLGLAAPALREERAERAIDQTAGEDFLLVLPPFALEEPAGDLARGEVVLAVVDGQGQEVDARLRLLGGAGGHEDHRIAHAHQGGAVGLLGHPPRFNSDRLAADLDLIPFHGH